MDQDLDPDNPFSRLLAIADSLALLVRSVPSETVAAPTESTSTLGNQQESEAAPAAPSETVTATEPTPSSTTAHKQKDGDHTTALKGAQVAGDKRADPEGLHADAAPVPEAPQQPESGQNRASSSPGTYVNTAGSAVKQPDRTGAKHPEQLTRDRQGRSWTNKAKDDRLLASLPTVQLVARPSPIKGAASTAGHHGQQAAARAPVAANKHSQPGHTQSHMQQQQLWLQQEQRSQRYPGNMQAASLQQANQRAQQQLQQGLPPARQQQQPPQQQNWQEHPQHSHLLGMQQVQQLLPGSRRSGIGTAATMANGTQSAGGNQPAGGARSFASSTQADIQPTMLELLQRVQHDPAAAAAVAAVVAKLTGSIGAANTAPIASDAAPSDGQPALVRSGPAVSAAVDMQQQSQHAGCVSGTASVAQTSSDGVAKATKRREASIQPQAGQQQPRAGQQQQQQAEQQQRQQLLEAFRSRQKHQLMASGDTPHARQQPAAGSQHHTQAVVPASKAAAAAAGDAGTAAAAVRASSVLQIVPCLQGAGATLAMLQELAAVPEGQQVLGSLQQLQLLPKDWDPQSQLALQVLMPANGLSNTQDFVRPVSEPLAAPGGPAAGPGVPVAGLPNRGGSGVVHNAGTLGPANTNSGPGAPKGSPPKPVSRGTMPQLKAAATAEASASAEVQTSRALAVLQVQAGAEGSCSNLALGRASVGGDATARYGASYALQQQNNQQEQQQQQRQRQQDGPVPSVGDKRPHAADSGDTASGEAAALPALKRLLQGSGLWSDKP